MKPIVLWLFTLTILLAGRTCFAQVHYLPWVNIGYLSSMNGGCTNCDITRGNSLRIGLQTDSRWGAYLGYAKYRTTLADSPDYEDSGKDYLLGVSFKPWRRGHFSAHILGGLAIEKFYSIYPMGVTEEEILIIPQFGMLFNYRFINVYLGMGATSFNAGVGLTWY